MTERKVLLAFQSIVWAGADSNFSNHPFRTGLHEGMDKCSLISEAVLPFLPLRLSLGETYYVKAFVNYTEHLVLLSGMDRFLKWWSKSVWLSQSQLLFYFPCHSLTHFVMALWTNEVSCTSESLGSGMCGEWFMTEMWTQKVFNQHESITFPLHPKQPLSLE